MGAETVARFCMLAILATGLSDQLPVLCRRQNNSKASGPLSFSNDGTFKVSIFEDLHFGENAWEAWGPAADIKTVGVINKVLDDAKPDLVVLNGDLITGENAFLENATFVLDQLVKPMVDRSLPWASTYGNHDYQLNVTGSDILAREKQWPNARTQKMVSDTNSGVSNYYLPVYPSDCTQDDCKPEVILWFFDSRGGFQYMQTNSDDSKVLIGQQNWVDESVVSWFKSTNSDLNKKHSKNIPGVAFVHIPPKASGAIQAQGIDPEKNPGINDDTPLSHQAQGWCKDGSQKDNCNYGGQDVAFMKAISDSPGMIGVFSGHDHGNSWCTKWKGTVGDMTVDGNGVNLCFGQRTGYGGYGNWIRGSRQLLLTRDKLSKGELVTSIRLESGNIVGSVTLNSTYGEDQYPVTPNDKT
ncbi:putative inactive purple acid phosphatase 16 [Colletotrichum spaethianum]|uniref:Inactive purple acid phosphatase 16 n=1 Tax=Colletotrichum spaethianum TaxID=700344 RepID=A0AA37UPQ8_9PEZI|nr:putative inactive purple acid phosphatase 16 [Colletotrichum spaethianum]GKT47492.1 putative inactive purple acid phosphatase 16 [Colletotrichum spaethianum]